MPGKSSTTRRPRHSAVSIRPRSPRTDGLATRRRIVDAAGQLCAARGYADVTSTAIANASGVDPASINFHFGSRQGLYQAVLAEAHTRLISVTFIDGLVRGAGYPRDKFRRLIEALVAGIATRRSWHAKVLTREMAAPSSSLAALVQSEAMPKLQGIAQIVSQITRIPPDDPAMVRCLLNVGSPFVLLFVAPSGVPGPLQQVARMPRAALVAHLYEYAIGGLDAVGRAYRQGSSTK